MNYAILLAGVTFMAVLPITHMLLLALLDRFEERGPLMDHCRDDYECYNNWLQGRGEHAGS